MLRYLILLIFLSLIALWPFARRGYFESHDGEWMVIRFTAFHQALTSGQFPVRYVERLNSNYGYPVLNFLYPLPFYLAEIPKTLGFGFVDSIKIVFILSSVSSVVAMFWALSQVASTTAAAAGAAIYLFAPYRFVDLYVRGSLGENVAFAFVPIIIGAIFKVAKGERKFLPILSLSIAALILSHNVIAILFLPFVAVWVFLLIGKKISRLAIPSGLGLSIAAFFWIPALYDLHYVQLSQIKVSEITNYLVDPLKLIIPDWGYGPSPNSPDGLSVQVGIVGFIVIVSALAILVKSKKDSKIIIYLLIATAVILFLNTKWSTLVWLTIPGVDLIQFPFRLHSILVVIIAYLLAYVINSSSRKILLASLVVTAAIIATIRYTGPSVFIDRTDDYYATNEDTTNVRDEYLPVWAREKPKGRAAEKLQLQGPGKIQNQTINYLDYRAQISSDEPTTLRVATIYFPDFKTKVDGIEAQVNYQNNSGLLEVQLPSGTHEVIISYIKSPVHLASDIISLLAILTTGVYFYRLWQKPNF